MSDEANDQQHREWKRGREAEEARHERETERERRGGLSERKICLSVFLCMSVGLDVFVCV